MKTITIIDDCHLDSQLLVSWLHTDTSYKVVNIYHSGIDAIKQIEILQTHFCLIDACMPLLNGIETAVLLLQKGYKGKVILISHAYYTEHKLKCMDVKLHGYCIKKEFDIFSTLAKVEAEQYSYEDNLFKDWEKLTHLHELKNNDIDKRIELLNPHYKKILLYASKGLNTNEVAILMGLKKHTVEQYRSNMMSQMGFANIAQAISWAIVNHIIPHGEVITPPKKIQLLNEFVSLLPPIRLKRLRSGLH